MGLGKPKLYAKFEFGNGVIVGGVFGDLRERRDAKTCFLPIGSALWQMSLKYVRYFKRIRQGARDRDAEGVQNCSVWIGGTPRHKHLV